jgi:hypothetical protein
MRSYHGKDHRVLDDGSIELEGVWAGVRPISVALSLLLGLLLFVRSRLLVAPALAFGLYMLVLPTRRRVIFDARARLLRVEHAGPFRERDPAPVPFASIQAVRLEPGHPRRVATARTDRGDVYLMSLSAGLDGEALVARLSMLLGPGDQSPTTNSVPKFSV